MGLLMRLQRFYMELLQSATLLRGIFPPRTFLIFVTFQISDKRLIAIAFDDRQIFRISQIKWYIDVAKHRQPDRFVPGTRQNLQKESDNEFAINTSKPSRYKDQITTPF